MRGRSPRADPNPQSGQRGARVPRTGSEELAHDQACRRAQHQRLARDQRRSRKRRLAVAERAGEPFASHDQRDGAGREHALGDHRDLERRDADDLRLPVVALRPQRRGLQQHLRRDPRDVHRQSVRREPAATRDVTAYNAAGRSSAKSVLTAVVRASASAASRLRRLRRHRLRLRRLRRLRRLPQASTSRRCPRRRACRAPTRTAPPA